MPLSRNAGSAAPLRHSWMQPQLAAQLHPGAACHQPAGEQVEQRRIELGELLPQPALLGGRAGIPVCSLLRLADAIAIPVSITILVAILR